MTTQPLSQLARTFVGDFEQPQHIPYWSRMLLPAAAFQRRGLLRITPAETRFGLRACVELTDAGRAALGHDGGE